mgnify:CR=1 FL=1
MPLSVFYILSTSILLNLILGVIILSNNIRNKINILFGLFSIGTILWNFAILGFFFIKLPEGIAHSFWINLSHFSAAFIALIFINFCTYFPQPLISCKNKNKLISIISAIPFLIIFYFLSFSNLIIGEVNKIAYELGSLYIPYTLYLSSCFLLGLIILIVQYKKSKENIQKTQIKYVLVGTVLPLILATITDAILPYL